MTHIHLRRVLIWQLALLPVAAQACQSNNGETPTFFCEAAGGKKYIELCYNNGYDAGYATAPNKASYLVYRFGSLDEHQSEKTVELEYPAKTEDSLKKFYGAVYGSGPWWTQSVRFVSGNYDYIVFTHWRGAKEGELGAPDDGGIEEDGVEIRDRKSGKKSRVLCSERPRFYISELKDLVACDKETPIGTACIK